MAADAGKLIENFLAGDMLPFVTVMPSIHGTTADALPEHTRVRLLGSHGGLSKGALGTIIHIYEDGGYEVEFIQGLERPIVLTLEQTDVAELLEK